MPQDPTQDDPLYLTTREVADLLRVKERKVYDLAAADEIPHRRITGKLLFPRAEIMAWIDGSGAGPAERPAVLTGSHDPLLAWAVRESDCGLATLWNGSRDGLDAFAARRAALSGLHIPEEDGWNRRSVGALGLRDCVLLSWASRSRGLLLAPGLDSEIRGVSDLSGRRVALRQPGAGASVLLDALLEEAGLSRDALTPAGGLARTESDAAAMVSSGEAEAALGIEAMARQFHLGFLPLRQERFDLLVDRRAYFTDPVQALLDFSRTTAFRDKAAAMGGYEVAETGSVRWLST